MLAIDGSWIPSGEDVGKSFLWTHLTRDELARLKLVTLPDNNTRELEYEGCGCAGNNETKLTDELGNYTVTKNDARGRLIEATEPNESSAQNIYRGAGIAVFGFVVIVLGDEPPGYFQLSLLGRICIRFFAAV